MQTYYAARATEYDQIYLKPERQADLRAIEAWLPPFFTGARVLEVACGTGYWSASIAHAARSTSDAMTNRSADSSSGWAPATPIFAASATIGNEIT